ncbi:MAG: DUF6089 family protein [Flavobacteriales bacterium]|nr:DUF6089 family protein [Flavobacteriales bacterium]
MRALRPIRYIVLLAFALASMPSSAQFFDKDKWEDNRHQLSIGFGASNFLGELGGKDAIGTDDFQDLELSETRWAATIGYKYTLYKQIHLRGDFSFLQVQGDDKLTEEPFRNNRNLNFRSNIWEFALMAELELPINKKKGHIYDIKGAKGWRYRGSSFYVFGGLGVFHYNPKTLLDGQWIELRPLRTEGQGLPDGPDEYGRFSMNIPLGLSYSMRLSHQMSFGIEVMYRYTFTDYIDDVSTDYFDPNDIQLYVGGDEGEVAYYLSNPALGPAQGGLGSNVTAPGQQRGDPTDDDGYMTATFKVHFLLADQYQNKFNPKRRRYKPVRRGRSRKIIF